MSYHHRHRWLELLESKYAGHDNRTSVNLLEWFSQITPSVTDERIEMGVFDKDVLFNDVLRNLSRQTPIDGAIRCSTLRALCNYDRLLCQELETMDPEMISRRLVQQLLFHLSRMDIAEQRAKQPLFNLGRSPYCSLCLRLIS